MNKLLELSFMLLEGFKTSLAVYLTTLIVAMPLAFIIAYFSTSRKSAVNPLISLYTWLIRGTPLLLQLYFMFYALPLLVPISLRNNRLLLGMISFIINYTAYYIEIFKGGFLSIDPGQWEAAQMLGMKKTKTLRYVIFPQLIRSSIHALVNEAINLIKDTALLAAVAIPDLLMLAKESLTRTAQTDALFVAALVYLLFTLLVVQIAKRIMTSLRMEPTH